MICHLIDAVLRDDQIIRAGNLQEAREILKTDAFDLIVLGHQLPDGNGLSFCRELRAAGERTPILYVTGGQDLLTGDIAKAGAQGLVEKNSSFVDSLVTKVDELLRR